jgi:hypothetical protein
MSTDRPSALFWPQEGMIVGAWVVGALDFGLGSTQRVRAHARGEQAPAILGRKSPRRSLGTGTR